jgi:hypothetical protein
MDCFRTFFTASAASFVKNTGWSECCMQLCNESIEDADVCGPNSTSPNPSSCWFDWGLFLSCCTSKAVGAVALKLNHKSDADS